MKKTLIASVVSLTGFLMALPHKKFIEEALTTLSQQGEFSGSVLMVENGTVIIDQGVGFADEEKGIKNTSKTRFCIGSISKHITAVMILMLDQEGKLSIHDPVKKYLPEFSDERVTIHHLLHHTSGLRGRTPMCEDILDQLKKNHTTDEKGRPVIKYQTFKEFVDDSLTTKIVADPGTQFSYSNAGYILLQEILERLENKDYETILQERICKPLHLDATSTRPDEPVAHEPFNTFGLQIWFNVHFGWGAGNIYSTTHDLYRWFKALIQGKIGLDEEHRALLLDPFCWQAGEQVLNYGCGLLITDNEQMYQVGHNGSLNHFFAQLDYSRSKKNGDEIFMVYLTNNGSFPPSLRRSLLNFESPSTILPLVKKVSITDEQLQRFVGTYFSTSMPSMKIIIDKTDDGYLLVTIPSLYWKERFFPLNDHTFSKNFFYFPIKSTFQEKEGKMLLSVEIEGLEQQEFERENS